MVTVTVLPFKLSDVGIMLTQTLKERIIDMLITMITF